MPERGPSSEPETSDWSILERVAAGEVDEFATLVERHQERLYRLCRRMLRDEAGAEDAVQEVFVKLFRKAGSLRPQGQLSTWLYRVAMNHCLNRLRRRRLVRFLPLAEPESEERPAAPLEPVDPGPDPGARLAARERWRRVESAIEALPAGQRAVLVLARFDGLSYREIAATLGITVGAVESRLFRAMRALEKAQETAG
ncbi:MAG TPA: sigma-70 family RNA polymerase sigma factor [Thermoanaerobaculia bacterium]|nr:sigma-70 family RNA polymerase sigma factor [Thermoanaerobaculia bacterium]